MNKTFELGSAVCHMVNNGEAFDELYARLGNKFRVGGNHYSDYLHNNGLYVYVFADNGYEMSSHCGACPLASNCGRYHFDVVARGGSTYMFTEQKPVSEHGFIEDRYGEFLGLYCKAKNILWATDWSHHTCDAITLANEALRVLPLEETKQPVWTCTYGTDPEFEQLDNMDEYEVIWPEVDGTDPEDEIGADGSGAQVELRPRPSSDPQVVVENIKNLIEEAGLPLSVRGDVHPLGGHIHVGFPEEIRDFCTSHAESLCHLYDTFLGYPMWNLCGSARGGYRRITAYEEKDWGFEYRTLPASWLINPRIARITLTLMKNLTETIVNKGSVTVEVDSNETPTDAEYLRFLSEVDYSYFKFFLKNYEMMTKAPAINNNWLNLEPGITVNARDAWDHDIVATVKEKIKAIEAKDSYVITLYGLRSDRGIVTTGFTVPDFENISNDEPSLTFGIPYTWRMEEFPATALDTLVESIRKAVVFFDTKFESTEVTAAASTTTEEIA